MEITPQEQKAITEVEPCGSVNCINRYT